MMAPFLSYMIAGLVISAGMLALAGPDAVRHAYVHSARPPIAWVVGVMALFWPWALLAALGK